MTLKLAFAMVLIVSRAPASFRPCPCFSSANRLLAEQQAEGSGQAERAEQGTSASEDLYAKPVTKQQITDLVAAGINGAKLAQVVQRRGIDFEPSAADLAALRKAGATGSLIDAVRDAPQFARSGSQPADQESTGMGASASESAPMEHRDAGHAAARKAGAAPGKSSGQTPVSKLELLRLVISGTPNRRTMELVQRAGLGFVPDEEFLGTLEIAGADQALRAAVASLIIGQRLHLPLEAAASSQSAMVAQVENEKDRIFQAGDDITSPKGVHTPGAPYTQEALRRKIEGTVALDIVVERSGEVSDVTVAKSLDPGLDANAVKTVRNWKFEPGTRDGRAVRVAVHVEINYKLSGSTKPQKSSAK